MQKMRQPDRVTLRSFAVTLLLACAMGTTLRAQSSAQKSSVPLTPPPKEAAPVLPVEPGDQLDRVVAIVNSDLVLDSDVAEEQRFQIFLPYTDPNGDFSRATSIDRLINRALVLQQAKLQPEDPITDADVQKDLDSVRKNIPTCKKYNCETKAGWDKFLADNGFSEATMLDRWRQRMEVLRFIDQRFRMGIKIPQADVQAYYNKMLLPEYAKQHVPAPKLDTISNRIQEVLLQQQVSKLLDDWLKSLRAQGSVVVLHPGEETP